MPPGLPGPGHTVPALLTAVALPSAQRHLMLYRCPDTRVSLAWDFFFVWIARRLCVCQHSLCKQGDPLKRMSLPCSDGFCRLRCVACL